jgi:DNA-binding transcriptional ArsR family regulator
MLPEKPGSQAALLNAVEVQRQEIRRWASKGIKELETQRDLELHQLEKFASVIGRSDAEPPAAVEEPAGLSKPKARRRRRKKTPVALAFERREAIFRFVVERDRAVAAGEIRKALGLSEFVTGRALKRLLEEGRIRRTGVGSTTRYRAQGGGPRKSWSGGSGHGQILDLLKDRGSASVDELSQALRMQADQVRKECGHLIREDEVRMARRDGQPVYVRQRTA